MSRLVGKQFTELPLFRARVLLLVPIVSSVELDRCEFDSFVFFASKYTVDFVGLL